MISLVSCLVALAGLPAEAQQKTRVSFARGKSSATVRGVVRGYSYRDHVVRVRGGQAITVRLSSPNTFMIFSIFDPDGLDIDGAVQTDQFVGTLTASGDHVIRVGLMRAEARRRGSAAHYSLFISVR